MLTSPYLIALGIPLLLLICSALARKIVRGAGWKRTDFFLGVELALASLGSAMVYFNDLQRIPVINKGVDITSTKIIATASFLAICFFLLLFILSTHQDWESRQQNVKGQILWLGIICNSIGISLFAAFVILVKGV